MQEVSGSIPLGSTKFNAIKSIYYKNRRHDMRTAIMLATSDAKQEIMATDLKVIVSSIKDGVLTIDRRGP
jgi:ABC-type phosphate transport system permease subunit